MHCTAALCWNRLWNDRSTDDMLLNLLPWFLMHRRWVKCPFQDSLIFCYWGTFPLCFNYWLFLFSFSKDDSTQPTSALAITLECTKNTPKVYAAGCTQAFIRSNSTTRTVEKQISHFCPLSLPPSVWQCRVNPGARRLGGAMGSTGSRVSAKGEEAHTWGGKNRLKLVQNQFSSSPWQLLPG